MTRLNVLLLLGIFSFGLVAMIAYVIAGLVMRLLVRRRRTAGAG